ncbi:MAG: hypothetical protein ACOX79_08990 [Methanosarcina sp.]|jgi:hypothetical protein
MDKSINSDSEGLTRQVKFILQTSGQEARRKVPSVRFRDFLMKQGLSNFWEQKT